MSKTKLPPLPGHQVIWILDAALKHFAESLITAELDLMRHQAFKGKHPGFARNGMTRDRDEEIVSMERRIKEYVLIVEHLNRMKHDAADAHAQDTAPDVVAALLRHNSSIPVKKAKAKKA